MKKLLTAIAVAVFVVIPSFCFASYVIHLKSGHSFQTDRYWEEGGEIKFKRYGGVVGVRKDLVQEIEEIEDLPEEKGEPVKPETPLATEKADDVKKAEAPEATEKAESTEQIKEQQKPEEVSEEEKAAKIEAFLEEKRRIIDEKEKVSSAFKEAKANKNGIQKNKYWNELLRLQRQLEKLRKQVMSENGGRLPSWWDSVK